MDKNTIDKKHIRTIYKRNGDTIENIFSYILNNTLKHAGAHYSIDSSYAGVVKSGQVDK